MSARSTPNDELKQALKDAEARLAAGTLPTDAELETLHTLAAAGRPLSTGLARRLARVDATHALRTRREPPGALEGFYEAVHEATRDEPFTRARLSTTYLEAPRSLTTWRRTATAACVLAAVAVGWAMSADTPSSVRPLSQVERYALLDGVLERYDPAAGPRSLAAPGTPLDVYEVGGFESGAVPFAARRFVTPRPPLQIYGGSWSSAQGRVSIGIRVRGRVRAGDIERLEVEKN